MGSDNAPLAVGVLHATRPSSEGEDRTIESLIANGDFRGALAMCAELYAVPLSRFCMAVTGSQAESEALVEETLLAAFAGFPQYREGKDVRAWLFGLARRISGRHVELRTRTQSNGASGRAVVRAGNEDPAAERARTALAKLKPSEREAVLLRYEAGLSVRELSIACGVDETAARRRISRALARLRAETAEE